MEDLTDSEISDKFTFGLQERVSEYVTKRFLNIEIPSGDGKDGKRVTLRDVGGEKFVEKSLEPSEIRNTELYKLALNNMQWQRDNYLVGKEYADHRRQQRNVGSDVSVAQAVLDQGIFPYRIPFDATALGNIQLSALGGWFIPSSEIGRAHV